MREDKKPKEKKYFIKCLRCGKKSKVAGIAKCNHSGSFAVKLLTKGSGR